MSDEKTRRIAFVVDAKTRAWSSRSGAMYSFPSNESGTYRKVGHTKNWTSLRVDLPTKQRLDGLRAQLHTLLNDVQDDGGASTPEYLRELSMVQLLEVLSMAAVRILEPASGKRVAELLRADGKTDAEIAAARAAGNVHAVRRPKRATTRRKSA